MTGQSDEERARELVSEIIGHRMLSANADRMVLRAFQAIRQDQMRRDAEKVKELFTDPDGNRGVWFRMEGETIRAILKGGSDG